MSDPLAEFYEPDEGLDAVEKSDPLAEIDEIITNPGDPQYGLTTEERGRLKPVYERVNERTGERIAYDPRKRGRPPGKQGNLIGYIVSKNKMIARKERASQPFKKEADLSSAQIANRVDEVKAFPEDIIPLSEMSEEDIRIDVDERPSSEPPILREIPVGWTKKGGYFRIDLDPLIVARATSGVRRISTLRTYLSTKEQQELPATELIRTILFLGEMVPVNPSNPLEKEREHDFQVVTRQFELVDEDGVRRLGLLMWLRPTRRLSTATNFCRGWKVTRMRSRKGITPVDGRRRMGQVLLLHREMKLEYVPKLYPAIVCRPVNFMTSRFQSLEDDQDRLDMLRVLEELEKASENPGVRLSGAEISKDVFLRKWNYRLDDRGLRPGERGDEWHEKMKEFRAEMRDLNEELDTDSGREMVLQQGAFALLVSDDLDAMEETKRPIPRTNEKPGGRARLDDEDVRVAAENGAVIENHRRCALIGIHESILTPGGMASLPVLHPPPGYRSASSDEDKRLKFMIKRRVRDERQVGDTRFPQPHDAMVLGERLLVFLRPEKRFQTTEMRLTLLWPLPGIWKRGKLFASGMYRTPDDLLMLCFGPALPADVEWRVGPLPSYEEIRSSLTPTRRGFRMPKMRFIPIETIEKLEAEWVDDGSDDAEGGHPGDR